MLHNEYTSAELEALANSVESRSLEDDIRETYERVYNRAVTALQVRHQEKVSKAHEDVVLEEEFQRQSVTSVLVDNSSTQLAVSLWLEKDRQKMHDTIQQLQGLLRYRLENMREKITGVDAPASRV